MLNKPRYNAFVNMSLKALDMRFQKSFLNNGLCKEVFKLQFQKAL